MDLIKREASRESELERPFILRSCTKNTTACGCYFKHSSIGDITDMYYVVPNIKLNDITSLMYKFEQSGIIFQDFEKEPYSNAFFDGLLTSSHTPLESIECTGFQWIPSGMFTNLALRSHLNKKT